MYNFIENVFQVKKYFNAAEWHKFEEEASNPTVLPKQLNNIHNNSFNNKSSIRVISSDVSKTKLSDTVHNALTSTVHVADNTALHSTT